MRRFALAAALLVLGTAQPLTVLRSQAATPLQRGETIALPNVSGRIDHLAFDSIHQRLYIAALGNNSVEVVELAKSRHLQSIRGFHEPQGVAVVPELNAVAIANGETGTLQLIDAQTFQTRWTVPIGEDADNVRYDVDAKRLYVAAAGGLYAIDPASGKGVGKIAISGHPESFQLQANGSRIFTNLPGTISSQLIAADRKSMSAVTPWSPGCSANYPMALDDGASRIFVGCRRPARVVMIDSRSGKSVSSLDTVGDTDDLFYDQPRQRVYVIGGEGYVDVLQRQGDTLQRIVRVPTRAGARTGLWVASLNRLFVALPARNGQAAQVLTLTAN